MSASPTTAALSPAALLTRIKTVDGVGSELDADQVRGRAQPTDTLRFDPWGQQFLAPPAYAETQSLFLFGV